MNADKNLIDKMTEHFKKYPKIEKAVLFGSRARGDNTEKSDYDIAVYGELASADKTFLRSVFDDELPTLHKIDLIFMSEQVKSDFTDSIEREGKSIYEKK